jgi:hypothetical protein
MALAGIDAAVAENGGNVVVTWGEPNGGSGRPSVESHVQCDVRARIEAKAVKRS